ncbi:MAG: thrombospondin type 3 repeat-containing protein [Theionarchaea archaeon]|nr:thrombospondin type 3 repeat-containing protein [Theionarchaea archaeon]
MKGIRLFIVGIVLGSLLAVTMEPSSCAAFLTINKGCGATYYANELITIGYRVTGLPGDTVVVTLKDQLPDATVKVIFANKSILPNVQYYAAGVVTPPYGTEILTLEWSVTSGMITSTGTESCSFTVSTGMIPGGTALRIDSNVSNFQVWWNGVYNHTTPYNYAIMYNVPSGTHTVTLKKSGCTDASQSITIVPMILNTMTILMDCGPGGGGEETPDLDGDGVPDDEDGCYNPDCNLVDSKGCPKDSDRDGINECDDECPTERGLPDNNGCPAGDKDNDGVKDDQDACYNPNCAIVDAQGCPKDTDDDGLADCDDECPSEEGERRNKGCPEEDSDSDGVTDSDDSCYNPGCNLVDSRGCPWDSDNDGINDCEDNCPNQTGPRSNNGCPEQEEGPTICLGTGILAAFVGFGIVIKRK